MNEHPPQKILLVDDSPTILLILEKLLEDTPFQILHASNGPQALRMAAEQRPHLILLDIEMPGMNGYEVCRRFKADAQLCDIPVLFMSSLNDVKSKVRSFEAGGQDYIPKPVQKEELLVHINTHLTLQSLRNKLVAEIEDKKTLIRVLTHDISNPLTAISGQADMIIAKSPKETKPQLLDRVGKIRTHADQIQKIIRHVRDMDAVRSGKKKLELEAVPVKDLLSETLGIFRGRIEEKNITVESEPALETLDTRITVERVSFTTNVLNNLLSNAVKFSFPGSVIRLEIRESGEEVFIDIKDRGIGIPPDILADIFSPSAPTSRAGTSGEKGTGFGMHIVKKYVELNGGRIHIRSKVKEENPGGHGPGDHDPADHGTEIRLILKKGGT